MISNANVTINKMFFLLTFLLSIKGIKIQEINVSWGRIKNKRAYALPIEVHFFNTSRCSFRLGAKIGCCNLSRKFSISFTRQQNIPSFAVQIIHGKVKKEPSINFSKHPRVTQMLIICDGKVATTQNNWKPQPQLL